MASDSAAPLAEPPDGPVAPLRTGEFPPVEHKPAVALELVGRYADERFETLALEIVLPISAAFDSAEQRRTTVSVDGRTAGPYAFVAMPDDVSAVVGHGLTTATIWIRRARDQMSEPLTGEVFTPQLDYEPGHRVPFSFTPDLKAKSDRKLVARWAAALASHLRGIDTGPWNTFAAARIEETWGEKKSRSGPNLPRVHAPSRYDTSFLMETTTGLLSVQEALQHDRPLLLGAAKEKRGIPIGKLTPPAPAAHPWAEMLRGLAASAPTERLASAVPAEFWYLRAANLPALFRLADQVDAWGTPAANLLDSSLEERDLAERYEAQLGVARTELGRALGPEVIDSVALTGSDPYLREGSDLSAIFRVKQGALFRAALEGMLATHAKAHGGVTKSIVTYEGVSITIATSADGSVRQHRASVDDLEIVSNSLAASKYILDSIKGKHPRLSDERDFHYMLARDAGKPDEVLGYFGDKFVAEAIGPRQKILEARRQIATAELMTPGFAALLFGFVQGKTPVTVDELVSSQLLHPDERKHVGGGPIAWRPGEPARSAWGSPGALTPLLDLPSPDTVTESERAAYDRFARTYEGYWSNYIDPAALRLSWSAGKPDTLSADLRILPLIDGTDYQEILEMAGQVRVQAPAIAEGMRAVVGIGRDAGVRRELSSLLLASVGRRHPFKLDFLGNWAMIGVADRARIADVARNLDGELPQPPDPDRHEVDEIAEAARVPAYAAIEIRSAAGAALALAGIRKMAEDAARDMLTWNEVGTEHGTTIVRVTVGQKRESTRSNDAPPPEISLFYALTSKVFLLALDERVLRAQLTDLATGQGPAESSQAGDGSQLIFDLAGKKDGALFTVLGWLLSEELGRASDPARGEAECLLRGAPERASDPEAIHALALAYFGAAPTPPYGGTYSLTRGGVTDPARGTASSPKWPNLPVPGSMVDKLLGAIGAFRSEISFDPEGRDPKSGRAMQSLHVRATLGLR